MKIIISDGFEPFEWDVLLLITFKIKCHGFA